jgi:aryl-alcohol dehydrogenase-like predicted oxidoreductase
MITMQIFDPSNRPISPIGLGLAALGRPGYINLNHASDLGHNYDITAMEAHAHTVLDAAWQMGVRYFDAARSYGRAEQFLGSWLRKNKIDPQAVTVGSKWGYTYTAKWQIQADHHEIKEHSLPVLQRQWQETEDELGHYLNIYQIHSATLESGVLENKAVLNELARLKAGGTIIGLSLSGANQGTVLEQALTVHVDGIRLFDTVQATWNLLEPSAGRALMAAHQAGMGIIVKEALANGRLTPRNTAPAFAAPLALLTRQAERLHTTVDALAIAAVLAQPWVGIVLSGAAVVEHVHSNLAALTVNWDSEAATLLRQLAEPPDVYWTTRKNLTWN